MYPFLEFDSCRLKTHENWQGYQEPTKHTTKCREVELTHWNRGGPSMAETAKELLVRVEHALGSDRPRILESLRKNGNLLARMPEELRMDKEVLVAIRQCGSALEFALEPLRSDRELSVEAVKQSGDALGVVQDTLKADKDIVLQAVAENGNAMEYADLSLRKDPAFLLLALGTSAAAAPAISFAAEELLQDKSFILQVVRTNHWTLGFLPHSLYRDPDIILEAVKRNGRRWNPLHPNCKTNGRSTWTRVSSRPSTRWYRLVHTRAMYFWLFLWLKHFEVNVHPFLVFSSQA